MPYERGFLEGRGMSGDGFAIILDDLTRVLEASGLGVRLETPESRAGSSSPIFVGAVLKTDDVVLMCDTERDLRIAYGIVKAWCYMNRFDLSFTKQQVMVVGASLAGREVHWSWAEGELDPFVTGRDRPLASYDLEPETYTLASSIDYLGDEIDDTLDPDFALSRRLSSKATPVIEKMRAVNDSITALARSDLIATMNALFRSAVEYPSGPTAEVFPSLASQLEASYAGALRVVLGDVSQGAARDALLEIAGSQMSLASRRTCSRAIFSLALAAVARDGPRRAALDLFRSSTEPAFVDVSVTHALFDALRDLSLPDPTGDENKVGWSRVAKRNGRAAEATRRRRSLESKTTARRLVLALAGGSSGHHVPLSRTWLQTFVLRCQTRGPTAILIAVLTETYRLLPSVRARYPGGPSHGFCDLCQRQCPRADLDHLVFDCPNPGLTATRLAWRPKVRSLLVSYGASFDPNADRLLSHVGLAWAWTTPPRALTALSFSLTSLFVEHFGEWELRNRPDVRRLRPAVHGPAASS